MSRQGRLISVMGRVPRVLPWLVIVASVVAVCLALSGCLGGPLGTQSRSSVRVKEEVSHEFGLDTFEIQLDNRGDAAQATTLTYSGEGPDPWKFGLNADAEVESPAQLAMVQAYGQFLAQLPGLVEAFAPLMGGGGSGSGDGGGSGSGTILERVSRLMAELEEIRAQLSAWGIQETRNRE